MGGFVVSGAKTHLGFDDNVKLRIGFRMKRRPNVAASVNVDRVKILFPFFVPVNLFNLFDGIGNGKLW